MIAHDFTQNVNAHTLEEMSPYIAHFVAWSWDGKKVLAHAKEEPDLFEEVKRLGLSSDDYVVDYVPDPNLSYFGWGLMQC